MRVHIPQGEPNLLPSFYEKLRMRPIFSKIGRPIALLVRYGILASFCFALSPTFGAEDPIKPSSPCREVQLARKPGWTLSGMFAPDGASLLIVDSLSRSILRYSRTGASLGTLNEPLDSMLRDLSPTVGQRRDQDLILEVGDRLMLLDKSFRPVVAKSFIVKGAGQWSIGGIWQWAPVGKGDIVAFADIVREGPSMLSNWSAAVIRFPFSHPERFAVLRALSLDDESRNLFRTGHPYIASIGNTAYLLLVNREMLYLYKNEMSSGELKDISSLIPGSRALPVLPRFTKRGDYGPLMAAIEKQAMPVGLYAWNGYLYILSRSPKGAGASTRWTLTSIDPSGLGSTGSAELPIRANHVTVVPGQNDWAFIEKGPVKGYGVQEVARILFIPANRLNAPLNPAGRICER